MTLLQTLVLLPALLVLVKSDFPFDVDELLVRNNIGDEIYRLPEDLDPIHIQFEMTPYFEAEGNKEAFTFDGIVTLTVRAVRDNVSSLVLHENVRQILSVTLTNEAGAPLPLDPFRPFERIREYHFLRLNLRQGFTLVNTEIYTIRITYIGNINETPLSRGVFRGSYRGDDGRIHWYAASHLQPTNSRQAFPCFDEPGFKSTFDIIVNRPENFGQTFSNMAIKEEIPIGNRVKEIFHTTPRMSAYLVTIHISEEFTVIADNNNSSASYRILARPNAQGQGNYALEVGPPITAWLENYFGIPYYTMGENMKNDQIASPDWASGATENWGLVSYRELRLLFEEGETNELDRMNIGTITAHELAHKWFGNLITCRWWDNVWINEGFASYFEYFAMDGVDPSMELEDQFNIRYLQSALSTDSSASTRALQHTVNSPAQVTGHFSGISYSKGASLLLMLKHFIGEPTFRKALSYFLVERAYEHAFPLDLFSNFARAVAEDNAISSDLDIAQIIRYWVEEPGYPVLNVDVDMNSGIMRLSQERFFISALATQTEQVWPLPLTFTTGNNINWDNLTPSHVMQNRTMEISKNPGHEWVIFNVQQKGIYRVNYDIHTWEMIANTLKNNYSSIHHLNRAQIVDDIFALMRSERITYNLGFQVIDFLKNDTNYYSWFPAITGFTWIRNRLLHLPDSLREFDEILYEFLNPVISDLGYDVQPGESLTRTLHRFSILSFACDIGHEGCITNAITQFNALRVNGTRVNPNVRRHVFCQGILNGGYDAWRFIYDRRLNSNNQADQTVMLRSLGCTTDERAIEMFLQMILSDDLKAQDSVNAFSFLFMGNRGNARIALQFVKDNVEEIRRKVVLPAWFGNVLSNLAAYMDEGGLQEMENWLRTNQNTIPSSQVGLNAIESARANMRWGSDRAQAILRAARGSAGTALPTILLLLTTSFALLLR
ncbi:unnamed protein product [Euphydryas editha]|uniref:Aminopeptidase n=1 Tax=Euphydryas editha TaxID=104508 RepID=A0AAU9V1S4_EUPED|nr:unnamed protein product [Euphydryas editha]